MTVTPSSRPENINGRSERRGDERAMYWRGMVSVETLLNLISLQIAGKACPTGSSQKLDHSGNIL